MKRNILTLVMTILTVAVILTSCEDTRGEKTNSRVSGTNTEGSEQSTQTTEAVTTVAPLTEAVPVQIVPGETLKASAEHRIEDDLRIRVAVVESDGVYWGFYQFRLELINPAGEVCDSVVSAGFGFIAAKEKDGKTLIMMSDRLTVQSLITDLRLRVISISNDDESVNGQIKKGYHFKQEEYVGENLGMRYSSRSRDADLVNIFHTNADGLFESFAGADVLLIVDDNSYELPEKGIRTVSDNDIAGFKDLNYPALYEYVNSLSGKIN